jgi:hypothetical protein
VSLFHNDLPAEKLAIGWHAAGLFNSLMKVFFSLALAYLATASWDALNLGAPIFLQALGVNAFLYMVDLVRMIFWLSWASVVIGLGGVGWHTWAVIQHRAHVRELRSAEGK